MKHTRILHTGDLHIGSSKTGIKNGRTELLDTFFRIISICKTEKVDFLLISGDLFDTPFINSDMVSEVIYGMSQIPETVIAISPGNHDCICPGSVWSKNTFPDNVYIFTDLAEKFDFPERGVTLFGAAFTSSYENIPLVRNLPETSSDTINIGVFHGDIVAENTKSDYNPITLKDLADSHLDYIALGHIHKRSKITSSGNTFFSYCGCPDGRGFDEDGSRGIYIGNIEKGKCDLSYLELSTRKYLYCSADISDCNSSTDITSKLLTQLKEAHPSDFKKNLYRITLIGTIPSGFTLNTKRIENTLQNEVEYIRITDNTQIDNTEIARIANENSLRGLFVQKMLQMAENADDPQKDIHMQALRIGLEAFEKGVTLCDN